MAFVAIVRQVCHKTVMALSVCWTDWLMTERLLARGSGRILVEALRVAKEGSMETALWAM